jgi:hypothetical protein
MTGFELWQSLAILSGSGSVTSTEAKDGSTQHASHAGVEQE